ncbi:hypothetical protein GCM10027217_10740 [Pseudomaricurvus hydrocarbonicus]
MKEVEETLISHDVMGFTRHPVRGRGEYFDRFNENHLMKHSQYRLYYDHVWLFVTVANDTHKWRIDHD